MHFDSSLVLNASQSREELFDEDPPDLFGGPDLISDDEIDYAEIARRTQPGQPGGKIVFDSSDYATDEAAMSALETLFLRDLMAPLDETPSTG